MTEELIERCAKAAYEATMTKYTTAALPFEPWEKLPEYWKRIYRIQVSAVVATLVEVSGGDEHVVKITEDGWTMQHPLTERLTGELFDCRMNDVLSALDGPPSEYGPGRYRVTLDGKPGSQLAWLNWSPA